MATPTPDPATVDHLGNARGRLLSQWKGKATIDLVIQLLFGDDGAALTGGWRDTEATLASFLAGRRLDTAVGAQQDGIGTMVGQTRLGGEADALYLVKLRAAVLRNKSQGREQDLADMILALLKGKATSVVGFDCPPAAFKLLVITSAPLTVAEQAALIEFVQAAKGAGIGICGLAVASSRTFHWDGNASDPPYQGFDDGTGTTGGYWALYLLP
jgi:hypothetical protein